MRKSTKALIAVLFATFLFRCSTLAPWQSVPSGQQAEYGRIETDNMLIQFLAFSDDPGICAIAIQNKAVDYPARYAFILDEAGREALRGAFDKYERWKGIAQENQTEISKTITTLDLQQVYNRDGGGWHDAGDREVSIVFRSRVEDNGTQSFSLALKPSPRYSRRWFYRVYGGDSLVLSDDQAITFSDFLSENALKAGYEKAKKKQDVINMFN